MGDERPRLALLARRGRAFGHWGDVLGVAWIALVVLAYLSPALKDGASFAPADLGRGLSLLTSLGHAALPNHNTTNGDIITQSIPWNTLDWRLVHHGELPLWNSLSGTGLPQLLNFESGVFALPTLVGYLFPLSLSFIVTVAMKLLIAGTGTYVLCRLLRTGPLAAAFGGTTAMLSGAFAGWLGWAVSGPLAWAGWIAAGVVCCYRSRGRARDVALLAVAVAFALYGGFPESYVLLAIGLGVLLVVAGLASLVWQRRVAVRGVARFVAGFALGVALGAPLWLAGLPVISASARNGKQAASGIPLHAAILLLAQGFDGLPIAGSHWFGPVNYFETAGYLGIVAIVLAVVAVLVAWRRPVVVGLAAAGITCLLVVYQLGSGAPVQHLLKDLGLGAVALQRMLPVLGFVVAVLAAIGLDVVVSRWQARQVHVALAGASVAVALVIAVLWGKVSSARMLPGSPTPLPPVSAVVALRRASLWWPTGSIALVLVLALAAFAFRRRTSGDAALHAGRLAGAGLLAAQGAFLLFAGVGINSYATTAYPVTPAVAELQARVGTQLLGLDGPNLACPPPGAQPFCGVRDWTGTGFYPVMNVPYGIDELGLHDPTIPQAYFDSWPVPNEQQQTPLNLNLFVPQVDTVALAHRYGVRYVLVHPGLPAPVGMRLVARLSNAGSTMRLYEVPGSARFSFDGPAGVVTSVAHPGDATYDIEVRVGERSRLVLRVTDVSGWHATADGKPLAISRHDGALMSVVVPAGTRTVVLHYWPSRLTLGFALALVALAVLGIWSLWGRLGRLVKRGRTHGALVPSTGG
ncbi:MAG TPA: YfhO family protein [Acidimicrobiales bacterium]|nr:YfhO family protein [Acidimicrobiales bacterium]